MKRPVCITIDELQKAQEDAWAAVEQARETILLQRQPDPGSISVSDYALRYQLPKRTAQAHLEKLVQAGKLRKVQRIVGAHKVNSYIPTEATHGGMRDRT